MTLIDDVIRDVKAVSAGRTRYEGQPPRRDELLVAEVDRLRCALWDAMQWLEPDDARELSGRTGIDPDQPCPVCGKRPLCMQGGN